MGSACSADMDSIHAARRHAELRRSMPRIMEAAEQPWSADQSFDIDSPRGPEGSSGKKARGLPSAASPLIAFYDGQPRSAATPTGDANSIIAGRSQNNSPTQVHRSSGSCYSGSGTGSVNIGDLAFNTSNNSDFGAGSSLITTGTERVGRFALVEPKGTTSSVLACTHSAPGFEWLGDASPPPLVRCQTLPPSAIRA